MSNLVVLAFDTETGAGQMRDDLLKLQTEHLDWRMLRLLSETKKERSR